MTKRYRFEQFFAVRRSLGFRVAPDGEHLYFNADTSGQFNLWRVPSSGGWPDQLTLFEAESVHEVAISPDGSRIAFAADRDADEQYQLYVMDARGGWPATITDQPEVQHLLHSEGFSPDGRYLAYSANARTPAEVDIFLRDLSTGEVRMICGGERSFFFTGFSPDGKQLLATQFNSNTDQDIWLVDVASGERRNLTAHAGQVKHVPVAWRPDGTGFYFTSNQGREYNALAYYDLKLGRRRNLVEAPWDVESSAALSGDGRLLAYTLNEAGCSRLHVLDVSTGQPLPLPALPKGVIYSIQFAPRDQRRRLFLFMSNYQQAGAVFMLDLDRGELHQVTQPMLGNIPPAEFVEPELVHITSVDGQQVPAWLYRPRGAQGRAKVPAVLSIHGGPEAQERPTYAYGGFYQYLLHQGIAVLAPNVRGSTGFGRAYQMAIHRDWGGAELKDIAACAQYLQGLDWVDPGRIGVWGGSFGGFATLSAATRLPDYWACAVDLCGPANLLTFVKSVPPHWKVLMKQWVGDAEEDRELLLERSPITYVEQLKCPLMVLQGANDPRVVKAESDQMVERLRGLGCTVEYMVFDDEGHGFYKRANNLKGFRAMAEFLAKHLIR